MGNTSSCPKCGATLPPDEQFCQACGVRLVGPAPRPKARGRAVGPGWLIAAGALLIVAAILVTANRGSSTATTAPATSASNIPYPDVPRIPAADSRARQEAGTAIILDVRSQQEFDQSHAADAVWIPLAELEARVNELPKDQEIIAYCT